MGSNNCGSSRTERGANSSRNYDTSLGRLPNTRDNKVDDNVGIYIFTSLSTDRAIEPARIDTFVN